MVFKVKQQQTNSLTLAVFYVGLFIGAGFASGQELWQYFAKYKVIGLFCLVLGSFLQGILGYYIVKKARQNNTYNFELLASKNSGFLKFVFSISEVVFIFFTASIMIAGANSLYESVFLKSGFWFSILFAVLVLITAFLGVDGVVVIFKIITPFLIVISALIFFVCVIKNGAITLKNNYFNINAKSVIFALYDGFLYIFHNVFLSLCLIIPFSKRINNNALLYKGFLLSSALFILLSLLIIVPLIIYPSYAIYSLPLLELSKSISPFIYYAFAFLLLIAMYSSCVNNSVAITNFFSGKSAPFFKNNKLILTVTITLALITSRLGFKQLITLSYPICGFLGALYVILLAFYNRKSKNK